MSLVPEVPRHGTSAVLRYQKCIPSDKFLFQAIYSQTYVSRSLPTPIIKNSKITPCCFPQFSGL